MSTRAVARLTAGSIAWPTVCEMTAVLQDAHRQMKCAVLALDAFAGEDRQARILVRELNRVIGDAYSVLREAGVAP